MGQFYNITGFQEAGAPWSNSYGTFQTYWVDMTDDQGNSFSAQMGKKIGSAPQIGQVYGRLEQKTSQNGNQYYKFASEQKPSGQPVQQGVVHSPQQYQQQTRQAQQPVQPVQGIVGDTIPGWFVPYGNMIKYVFDEMKKMEAATVAEIDNGSFTPDAHDQAAQDEMPPEVAAAFGMPPSSQGAQNETIV